uniref:Uncharacterized protein n=1 Tax=Glossina pallidipes TaxID=7398 RepID=A0A1B0AIA1_GLOPL
MVRTSFKNVRIFWLLLRNYLFALLPMCGICGFYCWIIIAALQYWYAPQGRKLEKWKVQCIASTILKNAAETPQRIRARHQRSVDIFTNNLLIIMDFALKLLLVGSLIRFSFDSTFMRFVKIIDKCDDTACLLLKLIFTNIDIKALSNALFEDLIYDGVRQHTAKL